MMKTALIRNYWMMIIAWIFALQGYGVLATLFTILACVMLCVGENLIINWRTLSIGLIVYLLIRVLINGTCILYYFKELKIFMLAFAFDVACANEYLYFLKTRYVIEFLVFKFIVVVIFSLITFILPSELYTMFTKSNLYLLLSIIFLPYLFSDMYCVIYKKIIFSIKYNLHSIKRNSKIYVNSRLSRRVVGKSY